MKRFNEWSGKPGAWYIVLYPYEWEMLTMALGYSPNDPPSGALADFVKGSDGNYYALPSAIFEDNDPSDETAIFSTGLYGSQDDFNTTYVNTSMMPSIFGG